MTTLTLEPLAVRPGDLLTAIGHITLAPMTIDREPVAGELTTTVHLEAPTGSSIEWQRYVEHGVQVTVDRPEEVTAPVKKATAPVKPKAPAKPYRLRRVESGVYETADGRYQIERIISGGFDDEKVEDTAETLWVLNEKRDGLWQEIGEATTKRELVGRLDVLYTRLTETDPPAARRVTRHGVRLVQASSGGGHYRTEDGRYELTHGDNYTTECETPHPVRYSAEDIRQAFDDDYWRQCSAAMGRYLVWEARAQVRLDVNAGRHGYMCEGETHYYSMWELIDLQADTNEIIDRGETMRDILASLPAEYGYKGW